MALNALLGASRVSRDIDLFHDTSEALAATWETDRKLLETNGYRLAVLAERMGFVEATVSKAGESVLMQWARDSAYRFFPLMEHEEFGLVLHPFDLATNKVLALVGRLEVRDWLDAIQCHEGVQPLGYLVWAACGKDPGFSPPLILEQAARARYSAAEVAELSFEGPVPDAGALSRRWRVVVEEARALVAALPPDEAGKCVLDSSGALYRGDVAALRKALATGGVRFHPGCIRGAWPTVKAPRR
ncbi:MAG: hypothetical protein HZA91_14225 [Verrucomicrobia bacterium]|nr:hypothetical protein [Verrucomicrobiota bacterium]